MAEQVAGYYLIQGLSSQKLKIIYILMGPWDPENFKMCPQNAGI